MRNLATRWTLFAFVMIMLALSGVTQADGPVQSQGSGPFRDVPADHWAADHIQYLVERGIIEGVPNGDFQGERAPNRYEVAAMLARALRFLDEAGVSASAANGDAGSSEFRPEDLKVLQDLIFKISDRLQQLSGEVDAIKSARPEVDPQLAERIRNIQTQSEAVQELQSHVQQQQATINQLEQQVQKFQVRSTTASEEKLAQADQQILANRIIGITGLLFAVVGIAITTLR